jgi:hypothetical protein
MATKTVTQPSQQPKVTTPNRKPIHEIRLFKIKAAIWQNDTDNGVHYNVTLGRLYKDGNDWKQTESFGRDDLPAVAEVVRQSWLWIFQKQQEQD